MQNKYFIKSVLIVANGEYIRCGSFRSVVFGFGVKLLRSIKVVPQKMIKF